MPYMRYSRKVWDQVKNANPHLKLWDLGKIVGRMWRELPNDEKTLFIEEYETESAQYKELLRQYYSSPTYQTWLVNKEAARKHTDEQDQDRKQGSLRGRDRANELPQGDLRESYILEDNEEDNEEQYTAKHVALARFQRNHRLMQEVLNDSKLPDPGQLITQNRLSTLRLQVEQLKNHKRNLCQEIEGCEKRHQTKVQRIREESERFRCEYEKVVETRPIITENQFAEMIVKAKYDIQREEEERRSRYLAELELRRRRQQQRQQREAELIEAERRRVLLHQQQMQQSQIRTLPSITHVDPNVSYNERPLERLVMQDKKEDIPTQLAKLPSSTNASNNNRMPMISLESGSQGGPSYTNNVPNTYSANPFGAQRFPQTGHTQHHYPPPPSYPPNSLSPGIPNQRMQMPNMQQLPIHGGIKSNPSVGRVKKLPSSASSTSSASSASSSTSSKKKKLETSEPSKDKALMEGSTGQPVPEINEQRIICPSDQVTDRSKPSEFTSASATEFPPSMSQLRHIGPPYQQVSVSPNSLPGHVPGGPTTPYGYEHGVPHPLNAQSQTMGYYHPSGQGPPNPSGYPSRPSFSQQPNYNAMQYPGISPQGNSPDDQPPPPPMYVQHIPQHSQAPPRGGPPILNPNQHPSGHTIPHPHNNAPNWHSGSSPYSPHYGISRYPLPGPPSVGYSPQPRHFNPGANIYPVSHHLVSHQPASVSMQDSNNGPQHIPAPPPYQQPPPQQQHSNSPMGYWGPNQLPSEYNQNQQQQQQQQQPMSASHAYLSQSENNSVQNQQQQVPSQQSSDSIHPGTTMPSSHQDVGMAQIGPQPSQGANIYYPGPPASYGAHGNSAGFYPGPQHYPAQHPHGGSSSWSGYPPNVAGPGHAPNYSTPQPHQIQQQSCMPSSNYPGSQIPSKSDQVGNPPASIDNFSGSTNNRPSSTNNP